MEKFIRQIIKEELKKAVLEISGPTIGLPEEDHMILNFENGRAFGVNKLANDINNLDLYYMNSYFPSSDMKESWMFEIENHYRGHQIVEIIHSLKDYDSYWKINIAEVERGSNQPRLIKSSSEIEGYKKFIDTVNSEYQKILNPDFL